MPKNSSSKKAEKQDSGFNSFRDTYDTDFIVYVEDDNTKEKKK